MITQTKSHKTISYADLKIKDRLKVFKGNTLECILEVDNILSGEIIGYLKNERGTFIFKSPVGIYRHLFSNGGIYNFGKSYGQRVHVRIELSRPYEWRKE